MGFEEEYNLTNQEILGGLKSALARGENLKQAMMSFYQAGYDKEEIENAAKTYLYLQRGISEVGILKTEEDKKKERKAKENPKQEEIQEKEKKKGIFSFIKKTKLPMNGGMNEGEKKKNLQKVSNYPSTQTQQSETPTKAITIVLIVSLIVLLGILAAVFLFKEELITFFNNLFG